MKEKFTSRVNTKILRKFRIKCVQQGRKYYEVIEELMKQYTEGSKK